jgi:C4-dicarboxylate-binding protein DctP
MKKLFITFKNKGGDHMKKLFITLLVLILSVSVFAAGKQEVVEAAEKEILIRLATAGSLTNPLYISLNKFGDLVQDEFGDKVKIEIYPSSQLGAEKEMGQGILSGSIQGAVLSSNTMNMVGNAPELLIFEQPFLCESIEQAYTFYNTWGKEKLMAPVYERTGFKLLSFVCMGATVMVNNVHPIETPSDCERLKIRSWESKIMLTGLKGIGANAIVLPYSEVIPGLQQGQIDGLITTDMHVLTDGIIDVVKYITDLRIQYGFHGIVVGLKWFNNLPEDMQRKIEEIGDKVTEFSLEMAQENRIKIYDEFEKKAQVTYLTEEQRAKFKEKTGLSRQIVIESVGQDLWDEVQKILAGI